MTPDQFEDELIDVVQGSLGNLGCAEPIRSFANAANKDICEQIQAIVKNNEVFVRDEFNRVYKFKRILKLPSGQEVCDSCYNAVIDHLFSNDEINRLVRDAAKK